MQNESSIWQNTVCRKEFPCLEGDTATEVLIIGGGLAGLLCAYRLQKEGIPYLLVEADRICGGVTASTTAKITVQHGLIYDSLLRRFGTEKAALYYEANRLALEEYRRLCREINCDFEEKDSIVYSQCDRKKLEKELQAMETLGIAGEFRETLPLPLATVGGICLPRQAQFHPLKFALSLAENMNIREKTKVLELRPGAARTNHGTVRAGQIVVATHFPFLIKHGSYFLKLFQHRSYTLALSGAPLPDGMYVDEDEKGLSFRSYRDTLLLCGGSHRTGKKGGSFPELERFAKIHYPVSSVLCRSATQDCMPLDGIPYIGSYSASTEGLFVTTGYQKWGMTTAMLSAHLLCDTILHRPNPFADVFSPSRSILHPQLAINAAQALLGLLTPVTPRCPHMGCALHYNKEEHSYDCSCHGSRFSENGKLLNGPANGDKDPEMQEHPSGG